MTVAARPSSLGTGPMTGWVTPGTSPIASMSVEIAARSAWSIGSANS